MGFLDGECKGIVMHLDQNNSHIEARWIYEDNTSLFAVLCMSSGYGLWKAANWARWLELLLTLPKLYCGYFELWIFKMGNSFVSLLIILLIFLSLASTLLLWVPLRSVESNPHTRSG